MCAEVGVAANLYVRSIVCLIVYQAVHAIRYYLTGITPVARSIRQILRGTHKAVQYDIEYTEDKEGVEGTGNTALSLYPTTRRLRQYRRISPTSFSHGAATGKTRATYARKGSVEAS